jgi:prolyl oligopeptidase PreP (S9A serine peptidase family)
MSLPAPCRRCRSVAALLLLGLAACAPRDTPPETLVPMDYPEARRSDHVDTYFGAEVADPYRWFEDLDSPETAAWVAAQNELSRPYLESIPGRQWIQDRLTAIWDHERYGLPFKEGGRYFYSKNDGLQNQSVWYVTDSLDVDGTLLLDPNGFREDGTVSLAGLSVSPDATYAAYARSDGGSDWDTWHVREVATGRDTGDVIAFTKFTGASWSPDERGFYYSRYPEGPDGKGDDQQAVKVYYHRLGSAQGDDELVYEIPDHPRRNPYASVTDDGRFLIVNIQEGYLTNAVHYQRLGTDRCSTPARTAPASRCSYPTLLYGYGGFNIPLTPGFSSAAGLAGDGRRLRGRQPARRRRVRQGLAPGRHQAAQAERLRRLHRGAEWLIANGYTSAAKLAIQGGSNGGLLVGACMTQRPELFGAALPAVGVMDMLRFHKFTIGWAWEERLRQRPRIEDEFRALLRLLAVPQPQARHRYPATLVTTADHDDRVVPAHSFKFAALPSAPAFSGRRGGCPRRTSATASRPPC